MSGRTAAESELMRIHLKVWRQPGPAQAPVISQSRDAFALLIAPVHGSESPKQARTKRKAVKPIPATRMADYRPAVRSEALPAGW